MSVRVSVIIPCYNQGHFIGETLESIAESNATNIEIIVINDGSTDPETNRILAELNQETITVVNQANAGLAAARNRGLKMAKGEFVLPLDSDNKIRSGYFKEGVQIMDSNPNVAVVYGNAEFFGQKSGEWKPGVFNLQKLMISNYIDACALIRKSVLDEVGFYDEKMKFMGWEDWDRWLRISFAGYKFHYLDALTFDYRVQSESMIRNLYDKYEKPNFLENYIHEKYPDYMGHQWIINYFLVRFKSNPILFLSKLFIIAYFPAYHKKLLRKNKIRNGL